MPKVPHILPTPPLHPDWIRIGYVLARRRMGHTYGAIAESLGITKQAVFYSVVQARRLPGDLRLETQALALEEIQEANSIAITQVQDELAAATALRDEIRSRMREQLQQGVPVEFVDGYLELIDLGSEARLQKRPATTTDGSIRRIVNPAGPFRVGSPDDEVDEK